MREWKSRLGLKDWHAEMDFKPLDAMPNMATNAVTYERRHCRIELRWPHLDSTGKPDDIEQTIVHELLHCWFDPWYPRDPIRQRHRTLVLENAVEAIATALVEAKRSSVPK